MIARLRSAMTRIIGLRITRTVMAGAAVVSLFALCLLATGTPATSSGYIAKVTNSGNSLSVAPSTCTVAATLDRAATPAIFQWALNDNTLSGTSPDASGAGNAGVYRTILNTFSNTAPLACSRDGGNALNFTGANGLGTYLSSSSTSNSPGTYSIEVWFKTSAAQGKLIGLGNAATGSSGTYDRHLYIDSTGKLVFGSYSSASVTQTLATPGAVTDGKWHLAVGTQSSAVGGGMVLYLDGAQVGANTTYTTSQTNNGYWRLGYDNLAGWPNPPANFYFSGQMRFAAAYSAVLTPAQVKGDWLAGS